MYTRELIILFQAAMAATRAGYYCMSIIGLLHYDCDCYLYHKKVGTGFQFQKQIFETQSSETEYYLVHI